MNFYFIISPKIKVKYGISYSLSSVFSLKKVVKKITQAVYLVYFLYLDMLNWGLEKSAYHR